MKQETIIQKFSVMVGAAITATFFVLLRINTHEVSNIDKFWISLPIATSIAVTDRCIFRRIISLLIKKNN
jgi:hypothetical protein